MQFRTVTLGDICSFKYGKMPNAADRTSEGYPIYSGYRVVGHASSYHYGEPEIIVVARGVGGTGDIKWSPPNCFLTNLAIAILITSPEVDKSFLYYRLASTKLWELRTGSAQAQITIDRLKRYEVRLPPLTAQQKIAAILSAYDDLIENNNRRIKTLEEMAQRIYREWFVDFRYPGHEAVPLVESELGPIPKGWSVRHVGENFELVYGKALKAADRHGGDITVFGSGGEIGKHDIAMAQGPGIVVGRKGNVGSVYWSDGEFFAIDTTFWVRSRLPLTYSYFVLCGLDFIDSHAAVPGLSREQAYALPMIAPSARVLEMFDDVALALFASRRNAALSIRNLNSTRDLLLPRLISGEVDVSDLDIAIPEAVA